jgi:hypothetical protein
MSNLPVQAQWSLSSTSYTTFSALRGILAAATTDNIQPLALLACEQFGSTLAISSETTHKIEHILLPSPEPALFKSAKVAIGFFPNDSATQLGGTAAGVRFLGLAAAFVSSLSLFESAKALDVMLKSSATDLTLLPNVQQLKDLLGCLEARSHRCGFADSVAGWQILLRKEVLPCISSEAQDSRRNLMRDILKLTPSPEAIAGLVDVFRQVARMGPATIVGTTIKVGAAAPWVLAFAQWCIEPPSLYIEGKGAVLEQPASRVRIVIPSAASDMDKPLEITIHHKLENLTRLLGSPSQSFVNGMVTVESYRTWLLQEYEIDEATLRIVREALEYAVPQVLSKMKCGQFAHLGQNTNSRRQLEPIGNFEDSCRLSPLPDMDTIARTSATVLGLAEPVRFASLDGAMLIADLPLVSRHLTLLAEKCQCHKCRRSTKADSSQGWCSRYRFFRTLSFIMMDIFALSLFDSPSPLLVKLSLHREGGVQMDHDIAEVIQTGIPHKFESYHILEWARGMVGHLVQKEDHDLIMTYGGGQVVYPIVFDTLHIRKQGYLKLCSLPGILRYDGAAYDVVSSSYLEEAPPRAYDNLPSFPIVSLPLNLFTNLKLSWSLSVRDDRELKASIVLLSQANKFMAVEPNPMDLLHNLGDALLVESCPHDCRAQLKLADRFSSYSSPWQTHKEALDSTSQVDVVAVDGADDLRCFAVACTGAPVVLRRNSCLACCLNVCRETNVHVLIL